MTTTGFLQRLDLHAASAAPPNPRQHRLLRHLHADAPTDIGIDGPTARGRALVVSASAATPDEPNFVRRAARAQRWQQPRVRVALALGCVLALALLAAQAAYSERGLLAAQFPSTRPALAAACAALDCRVEAARSIDSLVVDSSGLVRVEKSSLYKLTLALHNRSTLAVALPALDLTLSDSQGKTLARRVLRGPELGLTEATLAGGRDLALQATLQTTWQPAADGVAGYTIELFYP